MNEFGMRRKVRRHMGGLWKVSSQKRALPRFVILCRNLTD
jgi:hypothetical protein